MHETRGAGGGRRDGAVTMGGLPDQSGDDWRRRWEARQIGAAATDGEHAEST
jgi:hypothetical protein